MTLTVTRSPGFCAGVARAVDTVKRELPRRPLATLGPLTHNRAVTDELARLGARVIDRHLDVRPGETVVIRAHGVPPSVETDMRERGIPYIDCTCVCVKAVHRQVAAARAAGRFIIILGEAGHPEVTGIVGCAGDDFFVASDAADMLARLERLGRLESVGGGRKYTLVAQTTFDRAGYEEAAAALRRLFPGAETHDTLCDATARRYAEAESIAGQADVMLVLGDEKSANTRRLFHIAAARCPRTYLLASIHDLQLPILRTSDRIGLIAGASTSPAITKEAIQFMSDITHAVETPNTPVQPARQAQSFEEMLNESFISLHTGDIVKGTVISVSPTEVMVNLGYKSDGIITRSEITDDNSIDITQAIHKDDVFDVYVLRVNDGDGNVLVSKKKLDNQVHYKALEQAFNDKAIVMGKITEVVKGGLIAMIENCRVFVPSSQISNRFVDDLASFKGKELSFQILEYDRSKRRIVAGRKELAANEQKERRDELFATLEVGQQVDGVVSRIVEFGAFVDLGGIDGLIHISELAWKRVRKVTDILQVGQQVNVTVIDINPEKNKISLSLKDNDANPWNNITERYAVGSIIEGKVVRLAAFGAFIALEEGLDGLVHISQIANRHVAKPDDELKVGEVIQVMITDVDEENHKISLSKREADIALGLTEGEDEYEEAPAEEAEMTTEAEAVEAEAAEAAPAEGEASDGGFE